MSTRKPSLTARRAASVLERLLLDPDYRAEFREAPAATLERSGLDDLARELPGDGRALQTLELRAGGTSVAGVLMSAAIEGFGALARVRPGALDPDAEQAVRSVAARPAVRRQTAAFELPRAAG